MKKYYEVNCHVQNFLKLTESRKPNGLDDKD